MTLPRNRLTPHLLLALSLLVGGGSLLLFMLHLWAGSLHLVPLGLSDPTALLLDAGLSLAFFLQHSLMVRRSFRARLLGGIRPEYHAALYSIASGSVLLLVIILWQGTGAMVLEVEGPGRWLLRALFVLALGGFVWGERALGSLDALGIGEIRGYLRGRARRKQPLAARGPYRWVRHPLYLFNLVLIWSCPEVTADRLLFNVLWSGWIVVGAVLEERDLVAEFGDEYREYQRRVPMLVPWRRPWSG